MLIDVVVMVRHEDFRSQLRKNVPTKANGEVHRSAQMMCHIFPTRNRSMAKGSTFCNILRGCK